MSYNLLAEYFNFILNAINHSVHRLISFLQFQFKYYEGKIYELYYKLSDIDFDFTRNIAEFQNSLSSYYIYFE